ncbi:MAG: 50S ribosomal protein L24 [Candidatus Margulisbacteria bacterium]|nr:50S ribosomal protein L24 [Candidatus Margulisiibacteriota bacterium]
MRNRKIKIKKGDTVLLLAGKDKGKKGKVLEVLTDKVAAIVERMNVAKRHQRPSQNFPGGIIDKALPIPVSKLMLVCPRCGEPARVSSKEVEGKRLRGCVRCGEVVDKV